jgi:hypothetical protein
MASRSRTPIGRNDWSQFVAGNAGAHAKAEILPTIKQPATPLGQDTNFSKNTPNEKSVDNSRSASASVPGINTPTTG